MITVNKANPTPGEITSSLTGSTGDGSGLHFDGSGNIDIASPPDLGTAFSFEFVLKADSYETSGSNGSFVVDFEGSSSRFYFGNVANFTTYNLGIGTTSGQHSFGVKVLDDLKVHHLVVTVDGTAAVLYDNGNQVGTATIGTHNIDGADDAAIGGDYTNNSQWGFDGTVYRARVWNKVVDAKALFERADVDYSSQYGSQTAILQSDFSSGTSGFTGAGLTVAGNIDSIGGQNDTLRSTINSSTDNHQVIRAISGTNGKRYRATGKVYIPSANALVDKVIVNNQGDLTNVISTITATDTWTDFEAEFIREYPELRFRAYDGTANLFAGNGSDVFYIKDIKIVPAGCVSDYDLAFANPTQSLTVQDRSGAADGTASASGVTQVQPVVQLNSTSARIGTTAATPADGDIEASGTIKSQTLKATKVDSTDQLYLERTNSSTGRYYLGAAANSFFIVDDAQSQTRLTIDGTGGVQIGADGTARELRWGNTFANNGPTIIGHDVNGTLQFYPAGNGSGEAMKLASDKLATFSNGITVNGAVGSFANGIYFSSQTGAASPASTSTSVLNHYEEGTWTPSVGGDATYSAQTGRYTRIGRLVTATFDLTINVIGTGSTYIVSGLPFNSASGESIGAGGNINYYASLAVSPVLFAPTVAGSTVHIRSATSAASSPSNHGLLGNAARIAGIVTYTV